MKEEFIVASITSPFLSLGKLMKHGWNLQKLDNGLHLVKADKAIPVSFKRNSLCISGSIRMLYKPTLSLQDTGVKTYDNQDYISSTVMYMYARNKTHSTHARVTHPTHGGNNIHHLKLKHKNQTKQKQTDIKNCKSECTWRKTFALTFRGQG